MMLGPILPNGPRGAEGAHHDGQADEQQMKSAQGGMV